MSKLTLTIDRELLERYRNYKIDSVLDEENNDIECQVIQHIIDEGGTFNDLNSRMDDYSSITIDVVTGNVIDTKLISQTSKNKYRAWKNTKTRGGRVQR